VTFGTGIHAFGDGFRTVRTPGLRRYTWLPVLVSFGVVAVGLWVTFGYIDDASAWLTALLPGWLDFLGAVLAPILYLLGVLVGTWLFGFVAVLVASPFLGDLSLAVERRYGSGPDAPPGLLAGAVGALGREGRKLLYHLPRLLGVFVLTLIPVVNAAAPVLWFVFGAWTLAVEFADYPLENRGRPFRDTLELLRANRAAALGFGACATLALAVPLVNFLLVPAAVAGGTLLWLRLDAQENP
jgi:CysZ protein